MLSVEADSNGVGWHLHVTDLTALMAASRWRATLFTIPWPFGIPTHASSQYPEVPAAVGVLPSSDFASRWLQLPLYLGLIAAQAVYVFHFWVELVHLMEAAFGNQHALELLWSRHWLQKDSARSPASMKPSSCWWCWHSLMWS